MKPEFITYQKFNDIALANELAGALEKNSIKYLIEEESLTFDATFSFNPLSKLYAIKIKSEDFENVNLLLKKEEEKNTEEVDKDYYLFSFTNDELMEIITKADEWSAFDNVLARKILAQRGVNIGEQEISKINEQRIEDLKTPEKPQTTWIIIGYLIVLGGYFLPIFVIFIGLFIGWQLSTHKKTLPNGEKIFGYTRIDRLHGKLIFYLSVVVLLILSYSIISRIGH